MPQVFDLDALLASKSKGEVFDLDGLIASSPAPLKGILESAWDRGVETVKGLGYMALDAAKSATSIEGQVGYLPKLAKGMYEGAVQSGAEAIARQPTVERKGLAAVPFAGPYLMNKVSDVEEGKWRQVAGETGFDLITALAPTKAGKLIGGVAKDVAVGVAKSPIPEVAGMAVGGMMGGVPGIGYGLAAVEGARSVPFITKLAIESVKKRLGVSEAKAIAILHKMPKDEFNARMSKAQAQVKASPRTTGPTKPMTKLEERLQRGRDIAANQRAMRGNTPEEYPVQVGDQNNPNALPEMVPELPPYIGRPEAPPDLIETPPQKVYPPADPAAVEAILKRHAVEPGAVDPRVGSRWRGAGSKAEYDLEMAHIQAQIMDAKNRGLSTQNLEKELAFVQASAEDFRNRGVGPQTKQIALDEIQAIQRDKALNAQDDHLQLLNEPPDPPPTAPQLPPEAIPEPPAPVGPAVAPPQAMEAPMPQGYVPPVDPIMNPQRPTTGPPTEAVYSKLRDHPGYQALVAKIKGMSTPEAIKALLDEKVQDWLIAPTIEAAGGARPSPLMVRSAVNAAKDAAYDARVAELPKGDVVTAPPAFKGQQRAPFVKGATIPGAEDRWAYLQRTAKERGEKPGEFARKRAKAKTEGTELKAALESPAKPPDVESKIPEFTVAQKFKAEAESKGIQTPNVQYEVTKVPDAEYAKADANPDYVPMEETVGRITAPTEKHALQAVKDLQRRGDLPAGNLDLMTPGTKPFIDVEWTFADSSTPTDLKPIAKPAPPAKPPAKALASFASKYSAAKAKIADMVEKRKSGRGEPFETRVRHATTPENAASIKKTGFDPNKKGVGLGGDDYGPGVYLADESSDTASFWREQLATKNESGTIPTVAIGGTVKFKNALRVEDIGSPVSGPGGSYTGMYRPLGARGIVAKYLQKELAEFDKGVQNGATPNRMLGSIAKDLGYDGLVIDRTRGQEIISFSPENVSFDGTEFLPKPIAKPAPPWGEPAVGEITLSRKQMEAAAKKIKKHYDLKRPVTEQEVRAEIASLRRKGSAYIHDDAHRSLASMLEVGKDPIDLWQEVKK